MPVQCPLWQWARFAQERGPMPRQYYHHGQEGSRHYREMPASYAPREAPFALRFTRRKEGCVEQGGFEGHHVRFFTHWQNGAGGEWAYEFRAFYN